MVTVEFRTRIKDGMIHVPVRYRRILKEKVRVILISEEEKSAEPNLLRELLANPIQMAGFQPLSRDETHAR